MCQIHMYLYGQPIFIKYILKCFFMSLLDVGRVPTFCVTFSFFIKKIVRCRFLHFEKNVAEKKVGLLSTNFQFGPK